MRRTTRRIVLTDRERGLRGQEAHYALAAYDGPMFEDRREAGRKLAATLSEYAGKNTLVLALPRGGVEVAFEVAKALGAPLDTIVARKIGMPGAPEYAVGAIAPGEVRVVEHEVPGIDAVIARESEEIRRRMRVYK